MNSSSISFKSLITKSIIIAATLSQPAISTAKEISMGGIEGSTTNWSKPSGWKDRAIVFSPTEEAFIQLVALNNIKVISLNQIDYACMSTPPNKEQESNSLIVNGTKVRAYEFCSGSTIKTIMPHTVKGNNFIINSFRKLQKVNIKHGGTNRTFSAVGFTKASRSIVSSTGGI